MPAFTCKNFPIDKAPKRIELLGDKTKRPEPAQHIIEFPGGAIELTRTSKEEYWAHIIVHHGQVLELDGSTRESARGIVVASRIQNDDGLHPIPGAESATQIAVLIRVGVPPQPMQGGLFA